MMVVRIVAVGIAIGMMVRIGDGGTMVAERGLSPRSVPMVPSDLTTVGSEYDVSEFG